MKPAASYPRALFVSALLAWLLPKAGRAEGAVSYKYQHYEESAGRVAVKTHGAHVEQDLGLLSKLKLDGLIDAIAGATPNGQPAPAGSDQVPLTNMHDRRKAWNASVSRQFDRVLLEAGVGNSRESDYVSNGWSLNSVTDFNQKNTRLLAGVAGTDDRIKVFYSSLAPRQQKRTNDVILGVTQLLDPNTSVTANVTWGLQRGYLADQYKLVQKDLEVAPGLFLPMTVGESRPMRREKAIFLTSVNRAVPQWRGAAEATYRFYRDTFGVNAHTVEAAWFQKLGAHLILRPSVRWYQQTAADFYYYDLNATPIQPYIGAPRAEGPFYSSDYRLSAMRTWTYGVKLIWNVSDHVQVDAALEQYDMHGRDGVTSKSAYPKARIVTVGARFAW